MGIGCIHFSRLIVAVACIFGSGCGDPASESPVTTVDTRSGQASIVSSSTAGGAGSPQPSVVNSDSGPDGEEAMVLIPGGEFQMGSSSGTSSANPVHAVSIDAFYMDRHPVTNDRYLKFMRATGHPAPEYSTDKQFNGKDKPVVGVSWDDAVAFCTWAGKRLPTEAEWEKAARGGLDGKQYPWGNEGPQGRAHFGGLTVGPCPVGSFAPNGYGLYDMAGNVREWCSDFWESSLATDPAANPQGPTSGETRVVRGESWSCCNPVDLRLACRGCNSQASRDTFTGFRCARPVR